MNTEKYQELKSLSHSKGQNWYHVILVPRARCPVFRFEPTKRLCEEALVTVCKRHKIELFAYQVMPDHVHIFLSCPPRKPILKVCAMIKGGTSYYIRSKMPSLRRYPRLWSKGIFYRSVGNVSAESIRNYIENSKGNDWHQTRNMQRSYFKFGRWKPRALAFGVARIYFIYLITYMARIPNSLVLGGIAILQ